MARIRLPQTQIFASETDTVAKMHDTEERLLGQLRELTDHCRRIRQELERASRERQSLLQVANDTPARTALRQIAEREETTRSSGSRQ